MHLLKNRFEITFLFVLLFFSSISGSQAQKGLNLILHDDSDMHFGFQLGLTYGTFNVRPSQYFIENSDTLRLLSIQPAWSPSFSLGFILDMATMSDNINFRINPTASFYENNVFFMYPNSTANTGDPSSYREFTEVKESVEAVYFEFPLMLRYKSERRTNGRMSLMAGVTPCIKVGGRKNKYDKNRLTTEDYLLDVCYGFSYDMYFGFFKFSPEVRFSHGLFNSINRNGSGFEKNIEKMFMHKIAFLINFE